MLQGAAYWIDRFTPGLSPESLPGGAHLWVVTSHPRLALTGNVLITPAANPDTRSRARDVYRVLIRRDDYEPIGGPPLDRDRTLGMESLRSIKTTELPRPAGRFRIERLTDPDPGTFRNLERAIRIQFQLDGYLDALRTFKAYAAEFRRRGRYGRGDVIRCIVAGRRRLGVVVSNDLANSLATNPVLQVLLLGYPKAEWSVGLECVRALQVTSELAVLLKEAHRTGDHAIETVAELTPADRLQVDRLLIRILYDLD